MIKVKNLGYTFMEGTPFAKTALRDVSFGVGPGELVGVVGGSGAGKSTLLKLIGGLLPLEHGSVCLGELKLTAKKQPASLVAATVATVFQNPEHQFFAETIGEELAFGPRNLGKSQREIAAAIEALLPSLGFQGLNLSDSPFRLSGGEMRRLALASILIMDTPVVLLDEPTAGLDPAGKRAVGEIIRGLREKRKTTVWVGHDLKEMAALCDRFLVLARGELVADDSPQLVMGDEDLCQRAGLRAKDVDAFAMLREKYGIGANDASYEKLAWFFNGGQGGTNL